MMFFLKSEEGLYYAGGLGSEATWSPTRKGSRSFSSEAAAEQAKIDAGIDAEVEEH